MTTQAPPRPQPFTLPHFQWFVEQLVIDTGYPMELEDFQCKIVQPILDGTREVWVILPESNGKTSLMAAFALYHAAYTLNPWVPIAASSRDQAEILARQAYHMVRSTPRLSGFFKIYEGYREIRVPKNGGRGIKVYAADTQTGDGVIPTLAICDEGHRWADLGLYRLWKGKLNKRGGQIVMISTAGEPGTDFEEQRDKIRVTLPEREQSGCHLRAWGPNLELHEWRVAKESFCTDMERVKEANPFSLISAETLHDEFHSPTTDLGDWKRLKCNVPSRTSRLAITDEEWDRAMVAERIPEGEHISLGGDFAWKHDTTAFVPLWRTAEYLLLGDAVILDPPRDGSMLHPDVPKRALMEINDHNPIDTAVLDVHRAEEIAAWMEDELGITVIDRGQGNVEQCEHYDAVMKGLRTGQLRHTGDPGLRRHVMNAIARQLPGEKLRFDRPSQSRAKRRQEVRVIDALSAASQVYWWESTSVATGEPLLAWR